MLRLMLPDGRLPALPAGLHWRLLATPPRAGERPGAQRARQREAIRAVLAGTAGAPPAPVPEALRPAGEARPLSISIAHAGRWSAVAWADDRMQRIGIDLVEVSEMAGLSDAEWRALQVQHGLPGGDGIAPSPPLRALHWAIHEARLKACGRSLHEGLADARVRPAWFELSRDPGWAGVGGAPPQGLVAVVAVADALQPPLASSR